MTHPLAFFNNNSVCGHSAPSSITDIWQPFISVSPFIIAEFFESLPHILGPGCTPAFSQLFDETGRNEVPSHLTFRSGAILVGLP